MSRSWRVGASILLVGMLAMAASPGRAAAERIKDVSVFEGSRPVPLVGYGLVVGLSGSGDGTGAQFTVESLAAMLERMGVTVDARRLRAKNVAAVMVTCDLHEWVRPETPLDVSVASVGDASSLQGGTLLMTPLKGPDGEVYVVAQGPVSIGGFNAEGGANNRVSKNHSTAGRIPAGGRVVRVPPVATRADGSIRLVLQHADLNTAAATARSINRRFPGAARAEDAGTVLLQVPPALRRDPVGFLAEVGQLETRVDTAAKVVFNEKTGTIVVGAGVSLGEAAIAHGELTVEIRTRFDVSQPNSFNESGRTVVTPDVRLGIDEPPARVVRLPAATTVRDIVDLLNEIGATPRDIIAILQALRSSGSLQAELVVL